MQSAQQKKLGALGLLRNGEQVIFNKENVARIPHAEGHYEFSHNGKLIYIGVAGGFGDHVGDLHHRVQAYQEKDNYQKKGGHHSKLPLRHFLKTHEGEVKIRIFAEPITLARYHEHQKKPKALFNQDNQKNEFKNHGVKVHHQKI